MIITVGILYTSMKNTFIDFRKFFFIYIILK